VRLKLLDEDNRLLYFIPDVEKLSPEDIHIEVSTAIEKESDRVKQEKQSNGNQTTC